jgi:hypothetical protein
MAGCEAGPIRITCHSTVARAFVVTWTNKILLIKASTEDEVVEALLTTRAVVSNSDLRAASTEGTAAVLTT